MSPLLISLALAGTPEAPGDYMPTRQFDLVHLHLALEVDVDAGSVTGTATHTVEPLGKPSDWLRLHQTGLDITEVRVDGTVVEGWRAGHHGLDIPMPITGEQHEVAIDYSATPELGLHFRRPGKGSPDTVRSVWSQGQDADNRYWFPSWDYPNDRFTYSSAFTVPEDFVVASNGARTATEAARTGWKTETFALEQEVPTYLIALVVGDYTVYTEQVEDLTLEYIVPRTTSEADARTAGGFAAPQLGFFNELLGTDYAWPLYRQAFVQRFMYGGMENTSLTINSDRVVGQSASQQASAEGLVAHELAHQWFGDLLTCYGWRDRWLNEGFATMYASRWIEEAHGRDLYDVHVRKRMASAVRYKTPMARRSWSPEGPGSAGVYDRGMMVLHMLRVHLGDDIYDAGIRRYVAEHKHGFVETAHLRRALEEESGQHLGWLFDTWVHDVGVPELKTRWAHADGVLTVTISQGERSWHAPVQIEVGSAEEATTRVVWLSAGETQLVLDLDKAPLYVAVDPQGGVLARWDQTQSAEAWAAQARFATTPYARLAAFDAIGAGHATEDGVDALVEALRTDEHAEYRAFAARALGKLGTADVTDPLVDALDDRDERLRAAAVEALGLMPKDGVIAHVRSALRDESALVRATALTALGKLDPANAAEVARKRLDGKDTSQRRRVHDAALTVLGEHGTGADLALIRGYLSTDTPTPLLRTAVTAATKRVAELDDNRADKQRARLAPTLEARLYDLDYRARQAAIRGLRSLGTTSSRAALLTLASDTEVEALAKLARETAAAILTRGTADAQPTPVEDSEGLGDRIDDLEKRLEDLERWR
ncbi:MAG: M1 family metallopeptidase [Proteobacteria bacterium]|nr:M1 family metallopeptidase [Pseudomonadota bacterium]